MKYLNPVYFVKSILLLIKDLLNFNKYIKITKELEKSGELSKLGLRRTSVGKLYYVKNLQPEVLLNAEDLPNFELMQVRESLALYNDPIAKLGLIDFIKTGFERIKTADVYAYIIWMEYDSKTISARKVAYILTYLTIATLVIAKIAVPLLGQVDYSRLFHLINSK
jgi:hypothetical protein